MDSGLLIVIAIIAALAVILTALAVYFGVKDKKGKNLTGREALIGKTGVAKTELNPEGRVLVHGEWWSAKANENIPAGARVKVVNADSMTLKVERLSEEP